MAESDWERVGHEKEAHRSKIASLPIAERFRLLDQLRERAVVIGGARNAERPREPGGDVYVITSGTAASNVSVHAFGASVTLVGAITAKLQPVDSNI